MVMLTYADPMEPTHHSEYDRMMADARQALRRGCFQDWRLSPAALELAAEMDIDPVVIRTHIRLTLYLELLRRR